MGFPLKTRVFNVSINLSAFVILVLVGNVLETNSKELGGLLFGYKGKSYSFTTETCEGGVFFKKPLTLDYLCPNGYFLKRARGCSAKGEEIVGAEQYVCTDYSKHQPKVQALIPVTNPDYPTDHTVTLYDNEDMLTGFRRYTIESATRRKYIPRENGSSFVLISNPRKIPDISIGRLCYSGISQAQGSAYKVAIQDDFSNGESYGFFSKGCKETSITVQPSLGTRFGIKDGTPNSKRFARGIPARVINLEEDADMGEETRRVRKDNPDDDKVFLDLSLEKSEETEFKVPESTKTKDENEDSDGKSKSEEERDGIKSNEDDDKATTDRNPGNEDEKSEGDEDVNKSDEDNDKGDGESGTETISTTNEEDGGLPASTEPSVDESTTDESVDNGDGDESTEPSVSLESNTDGDDSIGDGGKELPNSELKPGVLIDLDKQTTMPMFFYEILEISKMYLFELQSEVDPKGRSLDTGSFLEKAKTESGPLKNTIWYQILKASVKVVDKISPTINPPVEFDIFRAFGYMFRNVDDDLDLITGPDKATLKSILDKLQNCGSAPTMKPPVYKYYEDSCPLELESVEVEGWAWNETVGVPNPLNQLDKVEVYSENDVRSTNWDALLGRNKFQKKHHLFVEMMFMVFDIASIYCFMDFKEDLNAHSRMTYYIMHHLFYNENVQNHWFSEELDESIYLTMVPSWDGRAFSGLKSRTRELDILRYALRQRVIPHGWVNRPDLALVRKMSSSDTISEELIDMENDFEAFKNSPIKKPQKTSFAVSERDSLPPPRRPKINRYSLRTAGILGTKSKRLGGRRAEWLKRKRRNAPSPIENDLKGREIWDGLAYCLSMAQIRNPEGQIKHLGLEPSLQTLQSASMC